MKTRRPIGVVRPLVPMLGRARRGRFGPSAPMTWRRERRRAAAALATRAPRPLSLSLLYAINVTVTPTCFAHGAGVERSFASLLREVVRPGQTGCPGPAGATRRLQALIERSLQRRDPAKAAAFPGSDSVVEGRVQGARAAPAVWPWRIATPARPFTDRSVRLLPAAGARPPRFRKPASLARGGMRLAWCEHATVAAGAAILRGATGRDAAAQARPRRSPPPPFDVETTRRRPRNPLVWLEPTSPAEPRAGGAARRGERHSGRRAPDLVWRDAPRREAGGEPMSKEERLFPARPSTDGSASAAALVTAAAPGPDVGRLVDEVVRRLERIGRDERLRRGL